MSHYTYGEIHSLQESSSEISLAQLLSRARQQLSSEEIVLEFSRDIIHKLVCQGCGAEEEMFAAVGTVQYGRGKCPACGQMRSVITAHSYTGAEAFGERTLDRLGLPLFDVFTARSAEHEIAFLMAGDKKEILGQMAIGASH
jgi:hypothetical protein